MSLRLIAAFSGCIRSSFDAATGRFLFDITCLGNEKKRDQLQLPTPKVEELTHLVVFLGLPPVRSSVGSEVELTALLDTVIGKVWGRFASESPMDSSPLIRALTMQGPGSQLNNAGRIRAIDVESTGRLVDGSDLAGFENVSPRKTLPSTRITADFTGS